LTQVKLITYRTTLKLSANGSSAGLQEAGTVLHLARSGRLIIKAQAQVRDGSLLVDENGRRTGRVMETIGSVSSPFLSVQPMTERIERIVGTKLYVQQSDREAGDRGGKRWNRQFKSNKNGGRRPRNDLTRKNSR
jgi:rRNA processing protein Gar1